MSAAYSADRAALGSAIEEARAPIAALLEQTERWGRVERQEGHQAECIWFCEGHRSPTHALTAAMPPSFLTHSEEGKAALREADDLLIGTRDDVLTLSESAMSYF